MSIETKKIHENHMKAAAAVLAAVITASSGIPAMAAGNDAYTPVAGSSVNIEKYLIMKDQANVPNVTFNYTIAAGTAKDSDGSSTLKVYAGNDKNAVTGTPTIGTATFSQGQTTYDEAQTVSTTVNTQKQSNGTADNTDNVTLADDGSEKYARSDVAVDFSGVSFKEPGVYRYVISETENAANTGKGIVYDTDSSRIMDVYVIDSNGTLSVEGYVFHNLEDGTDVDRAGTAENDTKTDGFVNRYVTHDLTLSKKISGNQASSDEYFKVTLAISNAVAGTVYDVDLTGADAATKTNAVNLESHTNPGSITVGADGTVTQDFWLQGNQNVVVKGLANNTSWKTNEDADVMDKESYDPTAKTVEKDAFTDADLADAELAAGYTYTDDAITADSKIEYTNTKSGTIPTGVMSYMREHTAYAAAILVAIAAFAAGIVSRRKKKYTE